MALKRSSLPVCSKPDVILMDIGMPRCDGIAATKLVHTELPQIHIVMLTTSAADDDLFEAMKSGASGYLLKSLDADTFFALLSSVMAGEPALSPEMASRILREFARGPAATVTSAPETDPRPSARLRYCSRSSTA